MKEYVVARIREYGQNKTYIQCFRFTGALTMDRLSCDALAPIRFVFATDRKDAIRQFRILEREYKEKQAVA